MASKISQAPLDTEAAAVRKTTAKKARKLTEKRKIQNRVAQRKYRERQAQQLEELKVLAGQSDHVQKKQQEVEPNQANEVDILDLAGVESLDISDFTSQPAIETIGSSSSSDFYDNDAFSNSAYSPSGSTLFSFPAGVNASLTFLGVDLVSTQGMTVPQELENTLHLQNRSKQEDQGHFLPLRSQGPIVTGIFPNETPQYQHSRFEDVSESPELDTEVLIRKALAIGSKHSLAEIISAGIEALSRDSPAPSNTESGSPPLNEINFDAPHKSNTPMPTTLPQFANPYRNTLTTVNTSTIQAYLQNALTLGYCLPEIIQPGCLSPFHNPHFTSQFTVTLTSLSLPSTIPTLAPPTLIPTHAQTLYPHNPYLDLIPFPTMRSLALLYTSQNPPLIDATEFKVDSVVNEGLICWAGGEGNGKGNENFQPWDMRCWEAKPWFLRKYWMLIGGEEGEVWKQSRWWGGMRGEMESEVQGASGFSGSRRTSCFNVSDKS